MVRTEHDACGRETRVRLPAHLPAGVVRRVVCQSCAQAYEAHSVEEVELVDPNPAWLRDPRSRGWRYLSVPVAAVAVIAGLMAIQGSGGSGVPFEGAVPAADAPAGGDGRGGEKGAGASADLVRESSFSLALPAGWQRTDGGGATFAAVSDDGEADATLWVERDPQLSFSDFEARSLDQLESLAGSARVVERITAPTADATIVRLAADGPEGSPAYEVTLRASGPYRYYLSTTAQPDASREALEGVALVHGSFVPAGGDTRGEG